MNRNKISKDRLKELKKQQIEIKKMEVENGNINVIMKHPIFKQLVNDIAEYFAEMGGVNYVEFNAWHEKLGEFTFLIQRTDGKTPAEINIELKKEISELKARINK